MCLGDADREIAVAFCHELVDLRLCFREDVDAACAINLRSDLCNFLFYGVCQLIAVDRLLVVALLKDCEGLGSEFRSAFAALCEDLCRCEFSARGLADTDVENYKNRAKLIRV